MAPRPLPPPQRPRRRGPQPPRPPPAPTRPRLLRRPSRPAAPHRRHCPLSRHPCPPPPSAAALPSMCPASPRSSSTTLWPGALLARHAAQAAVAPRTWRNLCVVLLRGLTPQRHREGVWPERRDLWPVWRRHGRPPAAPQHGEAPWSCTDYWWGPGVHLSNADRVISTPAAGVSQAAHIASLQGRVLAARRAHRSFAWCSAHR